MRRTRSPGEPQFPLNLEINRLAKDKKKKASTGSQGATTSKKKEPKVKASQREPKKVREEVQGGQEGPEDTQEQPSTLVFCSSSFPDFFSPSYYFDSSPAIVNSPIVDLVIAKTVEKMNDVVEHERTLGQLLEHNIQDNPGNIVIPNVPNFKLNPGILNVLPVFEGLKHENPYTHLASLHRKCTTLFGNTTNLDNIKLTLFSHTL